MHTKILWNLYLLFLNKGIGQKDFSCTLDQISKLWVFIHHSSQKRNNNQGMDTKTSIKKSPPLRTRYWGRNDMNTQIIS